MGCSRRKAVGQCFEDWTERALRGRLLYRRSSALLRRDGVRDRPGHRDVQSRGDVEEQLRRRRTRATSVARVVAQDSATSRHAYLQNTEKALTVATMKPARPSRQPEYTR